MTLHAHGGDGPLAARIMLVGESWGSEEERTGLPFQGSSGQELNRMLHDAGIMRSECYTTNVVNARPPYNDIERWVTAKRKDITPDMVQVRDRWVAPVAYQGIQRLLREIAEVQPNMIIALGNVALWALTGASGIMKWRGSQLKCDIPWQLWPSDLIRPDRPLPKPNVIPTVHPALILRDPSHRSIAVLDLKRAARFAHLKEYDNVPQWNFVVAPSFEQAKGVLETLLARLDQEVLWLDFDLETRAGHIACAGISWSKEEAVCVPFMCVEDYNGYFPADQETEIVWLLRLILTHKNARVRGQNLLYDAQYTYRHWHFVPNVAQDTMIAHHSAFCGLPKSLAYQASMYCDHYVYWKDDGKTWDKNMSEEQLWRYNGVDCVRTREVGEGASKTLQQLGLESVDKQQQEMFWPVLQCMQRGVAVNHKKRATLAKELLEEMEKRQDYFEYVLGHTLNPASKTQMQALFYEDLKQRPIYARAKKGKPGGLTLGKEALQTIWTREPLLRPLINAIREYRSLGIFLKNFAMAPLDYDGRMRTSYNICGTTSYRLASRKNAFGSGTNLQNVPKGDEASESELDAEDEEEEEFVDNLDGLHLPNIRKIFVPDPGYEMFDKDLSKADLRIVTWESDEPEMKAMLKAGLDPYVEIAREFYKDPSIKKTNPDGTENPKYRTFKSFAHGTHYLGTPYGLAARLGLSVHQAEQTQKWYLGRMKRIAEWQREFCDALRSRRYVENVFGYRRYYFGRIDDATCREAIAWVPQSTVALYINKIWHNTYVRYPHIQVLLQVHDSIVGQYPIHRRAESLAQLEEASQIVLPYDDPLIIPSGVKTSSISWGDC